MGKSTPMTPFYLEMEKGRKPVFVGSLLEIINLGDRRFAIFSVPK
jgi:hypothetical protein